MCQPEPFNGGCIFRISLVFLATGFIVYLEIWCENSVCADIKLGSKRPHVRNINTHLEAEFVTFQKTSYICLRSALILLSICLFKHAPQERFYSWSVNNIHGSLGGGNRGIPSRQSALTFTTFVKLFWQKPSSLSCPFKIDPAVFIV